MIKLYGSVILSWWRQLKSARSLSTKEWFPDLVAVDCSVCGAQTRLAAVIVGPTALVNDAGFKADDFLSKPWKRLDGHALIESLSSTIIAKNHLPHPDYALMLICDAESPARETRRVELWRSIAHGDYALIIRGHVGQHMLRDDVSGILANAVEVNSDLGLVLTEPHLAKAASPYVRSLTTSHRRWLWPGNQGVATCRI